MKPTGQRRSLAAAVVVALAVAPAPAVAVQTPAAKAVYGDGPGGRYMLGGRWLYRPDPGDVGLADGYQRDMARVGWRHVSVPNAFNAGDFSQASFDGSVGWYRKDFRPPALRSGVRWAVRFESVNYRARVWLNGRPLGAHAGAYLPFELRTGAIKRGGINRLVVRVDSRRLDTDVPPRRALWWNWGGILREVYLRRIGRLDIESVQVSSRLHDGNRHATVTVAVRVRNATSQRRGGVRGVLSGAGLGSGTPVRFAGRAVPPFSRRTFTASVRLAHPRLWWPGHPHLYRLRVAAGPAGGPDATYSTHVGVRTVAADRAGHVLLNGRRIRLRGAGIHEDSLSRGAALTPRQREASIRSLEQLGANVVRAHYPLHPRTLELCDRAGIVVWDQIPFYQVLPAALAQEQVRRAGLSQLRQTIARDRNHPSVIAYSIGNELGEPTPALDDYVHRAVRLAHTLDPTRLVALDVADTGVVARYRIYDELDALGINEYFGWAYSTIAALGPSLDALRRAYPRLPLFVTEFGAEANRHGPIDERGTYEFQAAFLRSQLDVIDRKGYLNGAMVWALREFAVTPGWAGGNPIPSPPFHKKGLIDLYGAPKPAFATVAARFRAIPPIR